MFFRPLQGYTNLTNQLLNRVSWLKALYSQSHKQIIMDALPTNNNTMLCYLLLERPLYVFI